MSYIRIRESGSTFTNVPVRAVTSIEVTQDARVIQVPRVDYPGIASTKLAPLPYEVAFEVLMPSYAEARSLFDMIVDAGECVVMVEAGHVFDEQTSFSGELLGPPTLRQAAPGSRLWEIAGRLR